MKKIFVSMLIVLSACVCGCGTMNNVLVKDGPVNIPINSMYVQPIGIVHSTQTASKFLGFSAGSFADFYLIQFGGVSFTQLLEKAVKMGADDIVNVKIEAVSSGLFFIYNQITYDVTALAVRYIVPKEMPKEPVKK